MVNTFTYASSRNTPKHRHVAVCTSTNSELLAAIKRSDIDPKHPYLYTAAMQTAGRGQHGNTWQSPQGNVYLSLYHPLDVPVSGLLSLVVGYYLTQMPIIVHQNSLRQQAALPSIGVKWVNDIGFYQTQSTSTVANTDTNQVSVLFNKLAGTLIEPVLIANQVQGVVIGIGLNVARPPTLCAKTQEGFSYQAIALQDLWLSLNAKEQQCQQLIPPLNDIYAQISQYLGIAINRFRTFQHTSNIKVFLTQFNEVDVLYGKRLKVIQNHPESETMTGIALGLDNQGCLLIKQDDAHIAHLFSAKIECITD